MIFESITRKNICKKFIYTAIRKKRNITSPHVYDVIFTVINNEKNRNNKIRKH